MEQNPLTMIVPIAPGQIEGLRRILDEIGRDVEESQYVRFRDTPSTHFARWVILLVCATNRELLGAETAEQFRQDCYYRIAGWACRLPPLRERTEGTIPLVRHFMRVLRPEQEPPDRPTRRCASTS